MCNNKTYDSDRISGEIRFLGRERCCHLDKLEVGTASCSDSSLDAIHQSHKALIIVCSYTLSGRRMVEALI